MIPSFKLKLLQGGRGREGGDTQVSILESLQAKGLQLCLGPVPVCVFVSVFLTQCLHIL